MPSSLPAQLVGAYAASFAKVLAWVVAAAAAYRLCGPGPFAFLMLLRGTLVLFNYTAFGLGPAVSHFVARAQSRPMGTLEAVSGESPPTNTDESRTLDYLPELRIRQFMVPPGETALSVITHAVVAAIGLVCIGLLLLSLYASHVSEIHRVPISVVNQDIQIVWLLGLGVIARAVGDVAGGASQVQGRLVTDQILAAIADLIWAGACLSLFWSSEVRLTDIGEWYLATGILACSLRWTLVGVLNQLRLAGPGETAVRHPVGLSFLRRLLAFGGLVTLASLGDFLYAPIDYVILNGLVDPLAVAVYAPAVQIDAAVILLVTALAAVILPRAAIKHAADDREGLWREYVGASLAAAGIAIAAGIFFWLASPWIFRLWLGDQLPQTQAILPWVLVHTAIGASAGVGRSTLLAIGKPGVYATSVLLGGLLNIALSLAFVWMGLGLFGVILGTILSVAIRCLGWMPLYVRYTLRRHT